MLEKSKKNFTIFGKLTVIKTLCLPQIKHIVTLVPNQGKIFIRELDVEFNTIINNNNPSLVDLTTRHMSKEKEGLKIMNIYAFWKAFRMSWFHRLTISSSTWAKLHNAEVFPKCLATTYFEKKYMLLSSI